MAMTDEDLARLVMSIDENDIEIIPSNGSESDDQLDFLPNHFALPQEQIPPTVVDHPPTVPLPVNTTIARLDSQDSEVSCWRLFSDLSVWLRFSSPGFWRWNIRWTSLRVNRNVSQLATYRLSKLLSIFQVHRSMDEKNPLVLQFILSCSHIPYSCSIGILSSGRVTSGTNTWSRCHSWLGLFPSLFFSFRCYSDQRHNSDPMPCRRCSVLGRVKSVWYSEKNWLRSLSLLLSLFVLYSHSSGFCPLRRTSLLNELTKPRWKRIPRRWSFNPRCRK